MNRTIKLISSISLFCLAQAGFACDYPANITVPDGGSASKDDLIAAQKAVKEYIANMDVYLECIVEEEKLARLAMEDLAPDIEQQREEILNKKYNAAWEQEKEVEAEWNATVQAYKARED